MSTINVQAVRAFNKLVAQYETQLMALEAEYEIILGDTFYDMYDRFMDKLCNKVAGRFGLTYANLRFEIEAYGDNWYSYYEESK